MMTEKYPTWLIGHVKEWEHLGTCAEIEIEGEIL